MASGSAESEGYIIRPNYQKKFRGAKIKEVLHQVMIEQLLDQNYDHEESPKLAQKIAQIIRDRLKGDDSHLTFMLPPQNNLEQELERYKYIVQVFIGEQKGEGANIGARCLWDSDADGSVNDIFMNSSLFCVATAFGIFYY